MVVSSPSAVEVSLAEARDIIIRRFTHHGSVV